MKQLMIHVERIVRPLRASQARKLRMRRELLGHLQAAMQEERGKTADEAEAFERAKERLGKSAELTAQLQLSVPIIERILLARSSGKLNNRLKCWRERTGLCDQITLANGLILTASGMIGVLIVWLFSPHVPRQVMTMFLVANMDHPVRSTITLAAIFVIAGNWVFALAFLPILASARKIHFRQIVRRGILILVIQAVLMILIMTQFARGPLMPLGLVQSLGACAIVLGFQLLVGRWIAARRLPYEEWETLDVG